MQHVATELKIIHEPIKIQYRSVRPAVVDLTLTSPRNSKGYIDRERGRRIREGYEKSATFIQ